MAPKSVGLSQGDVVRGDGGLGQALEPGEIGRGLGLRVVADQLQPGEAAGLQGLGDGSEADLRRPRRRRAGRSGRAN